MLAPRATIEVPAALPQGGGVLQMAGSLVLVLLVIGALAVLARTLQRVRGSHGAAMQLHGGLQVGPRERVVLLQVGDAQFLVGVAGGSVSLLHKFEGSLPVPAATAVGSPFAMTLQRLLHKDAPANENRA